MFGGIEEFGFGRLILPNDDFFLPTKKVGHEKVQHVFNCVAKHLQVPPDEFELVPQDAVVNPVLDTLMVVQNAPNAPAGTYQHQEDGRMTITYDPGLESTPYRLISTLAHELCHPILFSLPDPPPGGEDNMEFATDLAVAFLGFGLFGVNSAFEFQQYSGSADGMQGWSTRSLGYLTQAEWGFALAIFLRLHDQTTDEAFRHINPAPALYLKKSLKYLDANMEILDQIRVPFLDTT